MKIIFTFFSLLLFLQTMPAQDIVFTQMDAQVPTDFTLTVNDSFLLCAFANTEEGIPIDHVNFQLAGYSGAPGFPDIFLGGCVPIFTQYINGDLMLIPLKDTNHLNGVTTFDLVLIAKHILNQQLLPSPYKLIAADANNSGSISTLDMIEIRKLILGLNSTFPNNKSWRFIPADFVFPNPNNPWATALPEITIINNYDEDVTINYIGMKIGDVNGSAVPEDSLMITEDRKTNDKLVFEFENQKIELGEEIQLAFKADGFKNILGFQFELNFENEFLEFQGFEKGNLVDFDGNSLGFSQLQNGIITASWVDFDSNPKNLTDEPLFYLKFKSLQEGQLKDFIKFTENRLKAEAYNDNLEILDLKIDFSDHAISSAAELYQNQPNPFSDETIISFYVPVNQPVKLKVVDLQGNLVKVFSNDFDEGYHQLKIQSDDLATDGVYFYQLITPGQTITKKMVKF